MGRVVAPARGAGWSSLRGGLTLRLCEGAECGRRSSPCSWDEGSWKKPSFGCGRGLMMASTLYACEDVAEGEHLSLWARFQRGILVLPSVLLPVAPEVRRGER